MAREYNIDLAQVRGTGAGGRITKQDVEAYMASQGARTVSQAAPPRSTRRSLLRSGLQQAPQRRRRCRCAEAAKTRIEPMSTMRTEDRRAHGHEQTNVCARHHRASRST